MKKNIQIGFLFYCILFAFSCGAEGDNAETVASEPSNEIQKNIDYDEMADELCKCMSPLMNIQKKMAQLNADGKMNEMRGMLEEIEKLSMEGDECVEKLEKKYGEVNPQKEEKADIAFKRACPEIANMLEAEMKNN